MNTWLVHIKWTSEREGKKRETDTKSQGERENTQNIGLCGVIVSCFLFVDESQAGSHSFYWRQPREIAMFHIPENKSFLPRCSWTRCWQFVTQWIIGCHPYVPMWAGVWSDSLPLESGKRQLFCFIARTPPLAPSQGFSVEPFINRLSLSFPCSDGPKHFSIGSSVLQVSLTFTWDRPSQAKGSLLSTAAASGLWESPLESCLQWCAEWACSEIAQSLGIGNSDCGWSNK